MVKYEFEKVSSSIDKLADVFNKFSCSLEDINRNFEFLTNISFWQSNCCDYVKNELNSLNEEARNLKLVNDNIISFLKGVESNYKALSDENNSRKIPSATALARKNTAKR